MELLRTTLRNRDLRRIEAAWATATLGNWAFSILLALYAYRQGGTGAVALALVVRMLPSALAAPYTAMLVDRHSRRSVLIWTSVLRAVALAGAAAAAAAGALVTRSSAVRSGRLPGPSIGFAGRSGRQR